jgi:hypothetical protein
LSQRRQCGEVVVRIFVTGGHGDFGGGRHAPAHHRQLATRVCVAHHRSRVIGKHARHWREVAYIAVGNAEECGDGGLVGGDAVEIAHALSGLTLLNVRQLSLVVALPLNSELNVFTDTHYLFHLTPSA